MKNKIALLALLVAFAMPVFAQQADMSLIPYRKGNLWGYATPDKQIVIKPIYTEANLFYEGYASVKKGTMYGYINKTGKVVIPFKFYVAKPFRFGYFINPNKENAVDAVSNSQIVVLFAGASLRKDKYEICIDTKGKRMPKCPAINENSAPEINKPTTTTYESSYSTIQKSDLFDKIIGDYKISGSDNTYYIAVRNNRYGVFNNTFDVIVPFEYDSIKKLPIQNSVYLQTERNGMHGVFTGNGTVVIPVENTKAQYVKGSNGNDYFIVSKNGKAGILDANNREVVTTNYTDIWYDTDGGGFVLVGTNDLQGYAYLNKQLVQPKYSNVKLIKGSTYLMVTTPSGKRGFINSDGQEFFEE